MDVGGTMEGPVRHDGPRAPSAPLTARRSRGRRRCSRDPYPDIGNRYAITLQVVAAAGVADFPLYRGRHGDLRLRLVDGRRCVDRVTGVRRVWIGIVRIRER